MPRGKHNSKRGRSPGTRKPKLVKLEPETITIATQIGDGVLSDGLNKIFARMTTFDRVLRYLESRAEEDEVAEALLLEMQELGIERDYEEAIADGAIELPGGAWIT